jgi:hypothetical protein
VIKRPGRVRAGQAELAVGVVAVGAPRPTLASTRATASRVCQRSRPDACARCSAGRSSRGPRTLAATATPRGASTWVRAWSRHLREQSPRRRTRAAAAPARAAGRRTRDHFAASFGSRRQHAVVADGVEVRRWAQCDETCAGRCTTGKIRDACTTTRQPGTARSGDVRSGQSHARGFRNGYASNSSAANLGSPPTYSARSRKVDQCCSTNWYSRVSSGRRRSWPSDLETAEQAADAGPTTASRPRRAGVAPSVRRPSRGRDPGHHEEPPMHAQQRPHTERCVHASSNIASVSIMSREESMHIE